MTIRPLSEESGYTCDWGDCDEYAVVERDSPEHGWLPTCVRHSGFVCTVWAVEQGNTPPGTVVAIYDNEAAALRHVQSWDGMVFDHGSDMLRVVAWSVQGEAMALEEPS